MTLEQEVIDYLNRNPGSSSSEILEGIPGSKSLATLKRELSRLVEAGYLQLSGRGKGTRYSVAPAYRLLQPVNLSEYFLQEIDERAIRPFDFELIKITLAETSVFTENETEKLTKLQEIYAENCSRLSPAAYKKELERLAIDLSWKSSQIEGNTYSLLETERLLKEHETASGKTRDEATMLINHKEAIDFIIAQSDYLVPLSIAKIEDIHKILTKDLNIDRNIRNRRVGISGTNYQPPDNEFHIREALEETCRLINNKPDVFEKALLSLLLLSYIQPFADGNKRTARIVSNAILMNYKYCPLSFRTVDSLEYKKAMLLFYEQNNLSAFKGLFIEQFEFAVETYF
jgi:Fic family protein